MKDGSVRVLYLACFRYIFYLQCTHIIYLANLNISNKNMKIMCELIAAAERIIKMKGNSLITQK